jgi:hypothetical protein
VREHMEYRHGRVSEKIAERRRNSDLAN